MQPSVFYPIVPDVGWLSRIVPLGVGTVQLRIKDQPLDGVAVAIAQALEITRRSSCQLIVNDYWQQAIDAGADYIHLGQEDLAVADLKAIRASGARLGISTHNAQELDIALAAGADYVALGPVYATRLKAMRWEPQGLDRVRQWKKTIGKIPLVAIGGMTPARAPGVLAAGADSLAVITDVMTDPQPEARIRTWLRDLADR